MTSLSASGYLREIAGLIDLIEVSDDSGCRKSLDEGAELAVELILEVGRANGLIMAIGNGGSAAIAGHMHNDLFKATGLRSLAIYDAPMLTALANDNGYGSIFEEPVRRWGQAGDLLIAISSSGRSENILRGVAAAKNRGMRVITMSGFDTDNPLRSLGSVNFYVPAYSYGHVEITHGKLAHYMTDKTTNRRNHGK